MSRLFVSLAVLVPLASTVPAAAWQRDATFGATVHQHEFKRVVLETSGCELRYKLYFTAPPKAYPASGKGYYRFHARIKLSDGRSVTTSVFANGSPGERTYARSYDTSAEGCWASQEHKLFGVDVEACKGRGCTPDPFPPL